MYTLENEKLNIQISPIGAELKSIKLDEEEYLHIGDDKYWHRSSPILFPIVGRLKNNNYRYKNRKYTLPIHGFARFKEFDLIEYSNKSLTFLLKEDEITLKHYPFTFNLFIKYTLIKNSIKIDYKIKSKEEIIFGFGIHPAFLLKADINESYLEFESNENQNAFKLDLDTGCIKNQKGLKLQSNKLNLFSDIFKEDALIYKNLNSNYVSLKNNQNKKNIKIQFYDFPYLGIWSKVNAPYVCIEPWCSYADNINTNYQLEDKRGMIKLKANEVFKRSVLIDFN